MSKRRRRNKQLDAPHVRLHRWLLDSPTYLSLSCPARAVLAEIARSLDGYNNGRIGLSVRRAAERCNIAPRGGEYDELEILNRLTQATVEQCNFHIAGHSGLFEENFIAMSVEEHADKPALTLRQVAYLILGVWEHKDYDLIEALTWTGDLPPLARVSPFDSN